MSQLLIQQYLNQLSTLRKVSGTTRESVVREAFKDLLKGRARSHDLVFVPEYAIATKTPATGTGTFICELLEHFRGQPAKLKYKYLEELHANEVAILPYYVANLNIEATYAAIIGQYLEFPNLVFVDTLDNVGLHTAQRYTIVDMFGGVSEENVARIKRQNAKKISVIIGNPPYNANQLNENENNKNREYPAIDKRIKQTYIDASTAQKTKLYDMYARFFRWASDRLNENGVLAFVSNSSFIDSRTFDGFRKVVSEEFNELWIVDLKGNARTSGERRRQEGGNIFNDQIRVGVAVYFCVKKNRAHGCRIFYESVRDYAKADEKRHFLSTTPLPERAFEDIRPDAKGNWINLANSDFESLMSLASQETKAAKRLSEEDAIFKLFSNGINTARDDWVIDLDDRNLTKKAEFFLAEYRKFNPRSEDLMTIIKWSRNLKAKLKRAQSETFEHDRLTSYSYRPFFKVWLYCSPLMIDELGQMLLLAQPLIATPASGDFRLLATSNLCDFHFIGDSRVYAMHRVDAQGAVIDNITDWALGQFKKHYGSEGASINKKAIFHYVYGVLHDPVYREKYALNLNREFPRIPFYADFRKWSDWGRELMDLHIGYESITPWQLTRTDASPSPQPSSRKRGEGVSARAGLPKALLQADKEAGRIALDAHTTLSGIPPEAWQYKLGNRSALGWILDQYKETKPKDQTIREKFDTYRFADYKDQVIDLLMRVTTVSVRTQEIVEAMFHAAR